MGELYGAPVSDAAWRRERRYRSKLLAEQELVDAGLKSSSAKPEVEIIVIRRKREIQ